MQSKHKKIGFSGYQREDGSVGVRNYIAIMSTVLCTGPVGSIVSREVEGLIDLSIDFCTAGDETLQRIKGIATNPNIAGLIIVGFGCEGLSEDILADSLLGCKKPLEVFNVRKLGGAFQAADKIVPIAEKMKEKTLLQKKEFFPISELTVGIECGGSDGTSGITSNPATGKAVDLILENGGSVVFGEVCELLGCEHLLIKRAANPDVQKNIEKILEDTKKCFTKKVGRTAFEKKMRIENPRRISQGNIEGGLTTLEEKSLGAVKKSGNKPIDGILSSGDKILKKGLYIVSDPLGSFGTDIGHMSELISCGAQIIIFTTGIGSPVGSSIVPVIKVCGNPKSIHFMKDYIDIDASQILSDERSIQEIGEDIFQRVILVASGKRTKAEIHGLGGFQVLRPDSCI